MRVPHRGRAILRRLSPYEPRRMFRPGDFVLCESQGGLARLLGWAAGSHINHAALIVDPLGTVVESNPALLAASGLYRRTTIAAYLNQGMPCWIGYVELREGTREAVVSYAEHLLHARATLWPLARFWLVVHAALSIGPRTAVRRIGRSIGLLRPVSEALLRHGLVVREDHCYAAGELVARALERGGFIWECDPAHITPAGLFERFHLDDAPVTLKPRSTPDVELAGHRAGSRAEAHRSATITPFTPRATHGATALVHLPRVEEEQIGMRALLHLGVFMAAGLAVIGVLEEVLRAGE